MNITELSVFELASALEKKEFSSTDLTKEYLSNIQARDCEIGAFLTITNEIALKTASLVDEKRMNGEDLPVLAGIPFAMKDNICTKGTPTTCASKMLENFIPPYDAMVMEKLNQQQTPMLGKVNMDEFAMGSSTENSYFKVTKNPVDLERVPGGSSGGSAAAVASNQAPFSIGSDTGGSIRQPASFCGVVGMKPTYGTVSRYGLVSFASSLDQIGPITRTTMDSAMVLNAITGYDKRDSTSVQRDYLDYTATIDHGVKGLKIGLPQEYFDEGLDPQIKAFILNAAKKYESLGAGIIEVSMPMIANALPAYYVISGAEASSNLARFDGVKFGYQAKEFASLDELYKNTRSEGFGTEVKVRIMLGTFALSAGYYDAYYKKALQVRTLIMRDFSRVFETCDIILSPVAPTTAFKIGQKTSPLEMYMGDIYTVPVNIAGIPALTLPCGTDSDGLPIGMQLIGKAFDEALIYQTAYAYEQEAKIR